MAYPNKILVICGHGAKYGTSSIDPGAVSPFGDVSEYIRTREVGTRLKELMPDKIDLYPTTRDCYRDLLVGDDSRMNIANYDYVLEIHMNAFQTDKGNGFNKGVEVLVNSGQKDKSLAIDMVAKISSMTKLTNRGLKYDDSLTVMKYVTTRGKAGSLLEVCFIDDADDMEIYKDKFDEICLAIAKELGYEEEVEVRYNNVEEMPDWAQPEIQTLIENGDLNGDTEGNLNLSYDMIRTLIIDLRARDKMKAEFEAMLQK